MTFAAPASGLSALPLTSLPAIVLDTETTGLDTTKDRIVQIGAVKILSGTIGRQGSDEIFESLVAPGLAIPAASTAIHRITDADVVGAPDFTTAMARLTEWATDAVVLGHSLGFDLAVLEAEHRRHNLVWQPPRSLDVGHLIAIALPDLPGTSIDVTAQWLGIDVSDRHQALGDARITAEIFLALLPMLRARGIVTLAAAERACLLRPSTRQRELESGWHTVVDPDRLETAGIREYARIDSFPYRHRVRDVMSAPPVMIANCATLDTALAAMMKHQVSSVFLPRHSPDSADGIITERDILRAIATGKARALGENVESYATRPLISLGEDEFIYRAIGGMTAKGFRHFGVVNAKRELVGALSARDLLRQRAADALNLGDSIERAASPHELGMIWSDLTTVARGLVHEEVDARDIAAVISRELRALTRRACQIAEDELADAGLGGPPEAYTMLVLGSGGRGESLLAMDQDNAIVFEATAPADAADRWFERLGQRVADILNETGVSYCKGGVMAQNVAWRKSIDDWRRTIGDWITKARPEDILNADIFFDCTPVHGDADLGESIRDQALKAAAGARNFQTVLAIKAADFQQPLTFFGRLKLENGRLDLKRSGLLPLISTARVLALRQGLRERATPARLTSALEESERGRDVASNLVEAHKVFLELILRQQLRDLERGLPISNAVAPAEFPSHQRDQMRWALDQVPSVIDLLNVPMLR